MPRPRVKPQERKRIARACTPCKISKKRCNGAAPCVLCLKRRAIRLCIYANHDGLRPPHDASTDYLEDSAVRAGEPCTLFSPLSRSNSETANMENTSDCHSSLSPKKYDETVISQAAIEISDNDVVAPIPMSIRMLRDAKGKLSIASHLEDATENN